MKVEKHAATATLRYRNIDGGIVALSPRFICMNMKIILINPNPTSNPMIFAESQAYIVPPN